MTVKVKVDINSAKILKKKGLNPDGPTQRYFTQEVRRRSDPYVPKKVGVLKNTAIENIDSIVYPQIYAKKQYYENKGRGMRGKKWERRMIAQRGPALIRDLVLFIQKRG